MVDLHVHSNKSDGTLSPSELVAYAVEKGLTAFALTDHDTTEGLKEAMETAASFVKAGKQIEVIPGIEFSTEYEGRDVHILGLYIDYRNPAFQKHLQKFVDSRIVVDAIITVMYGRNIVNVAKAVQEKVMSVVQSTTGIESAEVNVHVSGVAFEK